MKLQENALRLYAVTDRAWAADEAALLSQVEAAIDGGAGMVQLREKQLEEGAFFKEAERFVALCRRKGVISIINDNVAVALRTGADGVHVGQEDLAAGRVRELLGPDRIIGVSAHNPEEALAAQAAGADYLGVGAAFVTGTKTDARPISRETIRGRDGGGGHPCGGHRRHYRGEYSGSGGLRPLRRGGGFGPVCPAGCEGGGTEAAAAFGKDCPERMKRE